MNDDQMDELLIQSTRDYNEPRGVPREAMWARIQAERNGRRGSGGGSPVRSRWPWIAASLAAALVLAAGISIGRRLERTDASNSARIARIPAQPTRDSSGTVRPTRTAAPESVVAELRDETRRTQESVSRLAERSPSTAGTGTSDSENMAYQLVMLRHIAGSEAMITAFRAAARRGEVDAQIADWSRELLGTTRMLEASPVTQDPVMKRLLEDLDLVIVQIAQYTSTGKHNPDDLDLIEQSINKRGVMTKLRSSLPGRQMPAGT